MKFLIASLAATGLMAGAQSGLAQPPQIQLTPVGTYASGIYEQGAAEIVAHDPKSQRLFVVNANDASVDVLSIANVAAPAKVGSLDLAPFGGVANSVAVKDGLVAVAVESTNKQANGKVVFFSAAKLQLENSVEVGALPDMVTFSPDGRWVLVANEGEPNANYTVDPEGTVSIIDLSKGVKKLTPSDVRTAGFAAFNSATVDSSIRIFGPGASVAQDVEPEYIAVSRDSKTAYVTCQENNAIAIVDIASATVTSLKGLGFKDHGKVETELATYDFGAMPVIGTTDAGQDLFLGGFSGLHFEGIDPVTGNRRFITHTDRGPNGEPTGSLRPFLLPTFTPELVRFELTPAGALVITQRLPLKDSSGNPLTGLPNTAITGGNASTAHNDEIPVDLFGNVLPLDTLGGDFEGVVTDPNDSTFWMVDEYRPAIYHFDTTGKLLHRYVPQGVAAAAGEPAGTFGEETLPAVLAQRRQNRGFEAVAYADGKVYAWVQSPLRNPVSSSNGSLNGRRTVRVVEFNPVTKATRQFLHVLDNADLGTPDNTRPDKIGDAVALGAGEFLVVERDDDATDSDPASNIEKKIYRVNLTGATDISSLTNTVGATGKFVDELTPSQLASNNIIAMGKVLHMDLNAVGYNAVEKVEGLTLMEDGKLAVINDNDFGVAVITINTNTGTFVLGYTPDPIKLGIITPTFNGLDASDRDSLINIRQWPVKGMFMPDAIAAFTTDAGEFLITANEGDARDYSTFKEEAAVKDLKLDPTVFPTARALQRDPLLGRLNVTKTMGDTDNDGDYDQLFSFGGRSFSIWNTGGGLVYDSRDQIERVIGGDPAFAPYFNASNTGNAADNRSDNKGPEPEGVAVGRVASRTYAFVGLERIGGLYVVDVSNPAAPEFVQYVNRRDFTQPVSLPGPVANPAAGDLGPEGVVFIAEENSPTGEALVVVGNEISGTTTIYQVNKVR